MIAFATTEKGFEPLLTESESAVLPLHHSASFRTVLLYQYRKKNQDYFLILFRKKYCKMCKFVIKKWSEVFYLADIDSDIERTIKNGKDLHRKNKRRLQT